MVQTFQTGNPQGKIAEMLGMSLGQGLGQGVNTFFANRSLESVMHDKSLKGASSSEKLGKLQQALAPYGEQGQQLFQQRMQIEQQAANEEMAKQQQRDALEKENRLFQQQRDLVQLKNEGRAPPGGTTSQPVPPEVNQKIGQVLGNSKGLNADELKLAMDAEGIPPIFSNGYVENRRKDAENNTKLIESGFNTNKDYINKITDQAQAANEMDMRLDQMLSLKDLPTPLLATTMESLGLPPSLFSSDAETAQKLSIDLTKNIQQFYGNRILQSEFQAFLQSIPSLKNTPEGRQRIVQNMKAFNDLKRLEYNTMRAKEIGYEEKGKPIPQSFRREVLDDMKPELESIAKNFAEAAKMGRESKKSTSSKQQVPKGNIRVRSPSGVEGYMSMENYNKAIKVGEKYEHIGQ